MDSRRLSFLPVLLLGLLIAGHCRSLPSGAAKTTSFQLKHDGLSREALLYVPSGNPGPRPLVIVLHGGSGSPAHMIKLTRGRWNVLADTHQFLVAYPAGYGRFWNDHRNDGRSEAHRKNIDDVGFLRALITHLDQKHGVDRRRIFVTGISNGGFMSLRVACEMSDLVRSVAAVTAQMPERAREVCRPSQPISVFFINGTDDPLVPFAGGSVRVFGQNRGKILSTAESVSFWRQRNSCSAQNGPQLLEDKDPGDGSQIEETRHGSCAAKTQVVLWKVIGGGHTWPGGVQYLREGRVGRTNRDVDAADAIRQFFWATTP